MTFEFDRDEYENLTLESAVFQALGAASACWENLSGAGEFQSVRAKEIGDSLVELIESGEFDDDYVDDYYDYPEGYCDSCNDYHDYDDMEAIYSDYDEDDVVE